MVGNNLGRLFGSALVALFFIAVMAGIVLTYAPSSPLGELFGASKFAAVTRAPISPISSSWSRGIGVFVFPTINWTRAISRWPVIDIRQPLWNIELSSPSSSPISGGAAIININYTTAPVVPSTVRRPVEGNIILTTTNGTLSATTVSTNADGTARVALLYDRVGSVTISAVNLASSSSTRPLARKSITLTFGEASVSEHTVLYFYTDTCPFCQLMRPTILDLRNKGYDIITVNVADATQLAKYASYRSSQSVPELKCAGSGEKLVGAIASEDILYFADECGTIGAPTLLSFDILYSKNGTLYKSFSAQPESTTIITIPGSREREARLIIGKARPLPNSGGWAQVEIVSSGISGSYRRGVLLIGERMLFSGSNSGYVKLTGFSYRPTQVSFLSANYTYLIKEIVRAPISSGFTTARGTELVSRGVLATTLKVPSKVYVYDDVTISLSSYDTFTTSALADCSYIHYINAPKLILVQSSSTAEPFVLGGAYNGNSFYYDIQNERIYFKPKGAVCFYNLSNSVTYDPGDGNPQDWTLETTLEPKIQARVTVREYLGNNQYDRLIFTTDNSTYLSSAFAFTSTTNATYVDASSAPRTVLEGFTTERGTKFVSIDSTMIALSIPSQYVVPSYDVLSFSIPNYDTFQVAASTDCSQSGVISKPKLVLAQSGLSAPFTPGGSFTSNSFYYDIVNDRFYIQPTGAACYYNLSTLSDVNSTGSILYDPGDGTKPIFFKNDISNKLNPRAEIAITENAGNLQTDTLYLRVGRG
ncbi:MAG: thioredoxin domain-containing protein [Candidatus Micrarchaeota archaeon]